MQRLGTELRAPEALKGGHRGGFPAHLAPDLVPAPCLPRRQPALKAGRGTVSSKGPFGQSSEIAGNLGSWALPAPQHL